MKNIKKLASMFLALVMVLSLAVPALADEGEETTETKSTYEIYQIFTGDFSEGILSNVKWGKNGTGYVADTTTAVPAEILEKLEAVTESTSDTEKLAVITKYADLSSEPYMTGDDEEYEGLPNGYYLVKNTDGIYDGEENAFYTLYVVLVVDNELKFEPKGDVPKSTKKIVEGDNRVEVNEASIGEVVYYEITGTLPTNFDDYNTYYYVFTDTLSKGLTFNGKDTVTVKVDDVDVTEYFYVDATTYSEIDGTTITVGIQDIKALNLLKDENENTIVTVTKDSEIVITYNATLNENAVIAGEGNPNDVFLTYSNDPNNSGVGATTPPNENPGKPTPEHPTGVTPKDEVVTYTTELTILKNDGEGNILPGVEFTLTGSGVKVVLVITETFTENENGEYWRLKDGTYTTTAPVNAPNSNEDYDSTETKYSKNVEVIAKGEGKGENGAATDVVGTVDGAGHVTFSGLGAGTYTIEETKTPASYNTVAPITFTLTFDTEKKLFESDNKNVIVGADNKLDITIVNYKGAELPSTGGMGTTIFYVVGSILVVGAVVLLVTKKRMNGEK